MNRIQTRAARQLAAPMVLSLPAMAALVLAAAGSVAPSTAHAAENAGVTCPAGSTATINENGNRLTCSVVRTYRVASVCAGAMDSRGADTCLAAVTGKTQPSSPALLPGMPSASSFTRDVNDSGPDTFTASRTEFVFPTGAIFVGNPQNGVTCPGDYQGRTIGNGNGLICEKRPADRAGVDADCDFPWSRLQDDDGTKDRCVLADKKGPTKPKGITFAQFQLEESSPRVNWKLVSRSGRDAWNKVLYSFPTARF